MDSVSSDLESCALERVIVVVLSSPCIVEYCRSSGRDDRANVDHARASHHKATGYRPATLIDRILFKHIDIELEKQILGSDLKELRRCKSQYTSSVFHNCIHDALLHINSKEGVRIHLLLA